MTKAGCRPPDVDGRKESNTKKNTFKHYGKDFV